MIQYKEPYIELARQLGLIDEIPPKQLEYSEAWIAGASRPSLLARIIYFDILTEKTIVKINGQTLVLSGERPLWAEIDGINPQTYIKLLKAFQEKLDINSLDIIITVGPDPDRVQEGQEYIAGLAERRGIKLNSEQPFITYQTKAECPPTLFPARSYPNYLTQNETALTESLMSDDLLNTFPNKKQKEHIAVLSTKPEENDARPNTITTARDAAIALTKTINQGAFEKNKDLTILFVSNNPYIQRQTIATQREVDKVVKEYGLDKNGYRIKVDGIGFANKQDVATTHSELAALIAEKWKNLPESDARNHTIEQLLFQARKCHDSQLMIEMPEIEKEPLGIIGDVVNLFQEWFDLDT